MSSYNLESTEFTPKVLLDNGNGKYEISGESRPENSGKFYEPILEWMENNLQQASGDINFEFGFEYFNSSSAKYILDVLKHLNNCLKSGKKVKIKWSYDELDEDMKESGEEFAKLIEVPFEFNPIQD